MQEFDLGAMENLEFDPNISRERLAQVYNMAFYGTINPVNGDSSFSFYKRIFDSINDLPEGNSAMFCHSGILKLFLHGNNYEKEYLGNLGMIMIEFDDVYEESEMVGIFYGYEF